MNCGEPGESNPSSCASGASLWPARPCVCMMLNVWRYVGYISVVNVCFSYMFVRVFEEHSNSGKFMDAYNRVYMVWIWALFFFKMLLIYIFYCIVCRMSGTPSRESPGKVVQGTAVFRSMPNLSNGCATGTPMAWQEWHIPWQDMKKKCMHKYHKWQITLAHRFSRCRMTRPRLSHAPGLSHCEPTFSRHVLHMSGCLSAR